MRRWDIIIPMPATMQEILIDTSMLRTRLRSQPVAATRHVATTPEVNTAIASNAAIAIGTSGGKDSVACALAVASHLDEMGHHGPRVLVHADLGRVEWRDSLPSCERLARHLGWELITVARKAGDMLARWEKRWENNVTRYRELSCVKLILPWSTPSMRFCTSELKTAVIASALRTRFPGRPIVNVTGVRREESANRSRMPVSQAMPAIARGSHQGIAWNAIIEWTLEDVFATITGAGLALHEAYARYGASRVSCAYCIMSSADDLRAAASCEDNHDVYRAMVDLEVRSSFAFQGKRWLLDVAPHLLPDRTRAVSCDVKIRAAERQKIESAIPAHLLFKTGWPDVRPTREEAALLAKVRCSVARLLSLDINVATARAVMDRYDDLLARKPSAAQTACVESTPEKPAQAELAF